jgi:nitroimidazol reductase NimA-like FMN-containing flavoprotein (pyridoxamine 5'-phosphate oxidase superfamily)
MSSYEDPVTTLDEEESWNLLASRTLGRLVTAVAGQPEIFPVNFVVQHRTVLIRTAEGTKLLMAAIGGRVAFEADDHGLEEGWSVIVKGRASVLSTSAEVAEADRAQLLSWTPILKLHYVRILPTEISGRGFRFGAEPDRQDVFA